MAASGKGSRGRWLKQSEVEWLPKLLCPHFNTDIGHFLSIPAVQHFSVRWAQPFPAPSLIIASCPHFLLCSYQLPRSSFTIFKSHWQIWEYFKRIDVQINALTTHRCQTLLFSYHTLQLFWEVYKYLQIASQKKKPNKCFVWVFPPKSRLYCHQ